MYVTLTYTHTNKQMPITIASNQFLSLHFLFSILCLFILSKIIHSFHFDFIRRIKQQLKFRQKHRAGEMFLVSALKMLNCFFISIRTKKKNNCTQWVYSWWVATTQEVHKIQSINATWMCNKSNAVRLKFAIYFYLLFSVFIWFLSKFSFTTILIFSECTCSVFLTGAPFLLQFSTLHPVTSAAS